MSAILNAPDVSAVWAVYIDILQSLGFDKVIYGATHFPSGGIIGDPNDALILHHGPQGYADVYIGEELYLHSPTYAWAENHSGFASWDDAAAQMMRDPPTARQKRVVALNQKFGIRAGYVGSLRGVVPGMRGVLGISPAEDLDQRETDLLWRDVGTDIEMFSQLMHLRIANLPQPGQRRPLTSRQREALHWCAQGKTMQDIATIMGLSVGTVEKHLRMARGALDAQTTAHAVQKATALNLLTQEGAPDHSAI